MIELDRRGRREDRRGEKNRARDGDLMLIVFRDVQTVFQVVAPSSVDLDVWLAQLHAFGDQFGD